jgi:hypothetical protein
MPDKRNDQIVSSPMEENVSPIFWLNSTGKVREVNPIFFNLLKLNVIKRD